MRKWIKKHKKLVIFLAILLVVILIIVYFVVKVREAAQMLTDMANSGEVVQIEKQALINSLSATGSITSLDEEEIIANVNGVEVLEVNVEVGDYVKAGDVICILDSEDLQKSLDNAKATLNVSEKTADANIAVAKRGLNESQVAEATTISRDTEDLNARYQDYLDAVQAYDDAKAAYDTTVDVYNWRKGEYEEYREEHSDLDEYEFLNRTERGNYYKSNMTSAENDMKSNENTLKQKEDAVETALENYNKMVRSYEDNIRNGDSTIMSKNDSLSSAKLNGTTAGLNDEQQISKYEDQVAACTVTSPIDGIVTSVSVSEGATYGGTAVATVEDTSGFEVTAQIDEYDITKVKEGQKVVIKTNGTGDLELAGHVKEIAPRATKSTNAQQTNTSVTYKVVISIDDECSDLKLDMTAKLSIIIDRKDDVLSVPYDAVQTDEDGNFYLELADETGMAKVDPQTGLPVHERIYVTKGIESDYYIEVLGDDVKEGLSVIVPAQNGLNDFLMMLQENGAMGGM